MSSKRYIQYTPKAVVQIEHIVTVQVDDGAVQFDTVNCTDDEVYTVDPAYAHAFLTVLNLPNLNDCLTQNNTQHTDPKPQRTPTREPITGIPSTSTGRQASSYGDSCTGDDESDTKEVQILPERCSDTARLIERCTCPRHDNGATRTY